MTILERGDLWVCLSAGCRFICPVADEDRALDHSKVCNPGAADERAALEDMLAGFADRVRKEFASDVSDYLVGEVFEKRRIQRTAAAGETVLDAAAAEQALILAIATMRVAAGLGPVVL